MDLNEFMERAAALKKQPAKQKGNYSLKGKNLAIRRGSRSRWGSHVCKHVRLCATMLSYGLMVHRLPIVGQARSVPSSWPSALSIQDWLLQLCHFALCCWCFLSLDSVHIEVTCIFINLSMYLWICSASLLFMTTLPTHARRWPVTVACPVHRL